ncbi:MAG TPA: hypothetical protein DEB39_09555 [Planctomycetaceae bacterium]|nr:hypothetical protein [Planctomycetaceae bacterium]
MHFEILVEGTSDKTALWSLMGKILGERGNPHTWYIRKHRGVGKIPKDPSQNPNPKDQTLLHNLSSKLKAYGREENRELVVVVLVDLDEHPDCIAFKTELTALLDYCDVKPKCLFRIAVEELEAWYLGDRAALVKVYPKAKIDVLDDYVQDARCGTWERLADAIYPGGVKKLTAGGKRNSQALEQKVKWAAALAPEMDVENNRSPSFQCFRDGIRTLASHPLAPHVHQKNPARKTSQKKKT